MKRNGSVIVLLLFLVLFLLTSCGSLNNYDKYYTITFKNYDGTILQTDSIREGVMPTYNNSDPKRKKDDKYFYEFNGWNPSITEVSADAIYRATYTKKDIQSYTVTFKNYDGTILQTDSIEVEETPIYSNSIPTREQDDKYTYTFNGWTPSITEVYADIEYTATFSQTSLYYKREDNKIYFGSYPQKLIDEANNEALINELNNITANKAWISYDYYVNSQITSFMYYIDVDYDNNGIFDYRGVYFTQYRPNNYLSESTNNSYQYENGYLTNKKYWFSYDEIEWIVLSEENGQALILANLVLDSQDYYPSNNAEEFEHNGGEGFANNYELSNIRKWLNDNFYNTAFNDLEKALIEKTTIDNSLSSTATSTNKYICNNTEDKIFLLSYGEALKYCTPNDFKYTKGTDYAKCQGLYVYTSSEEYSGNSNWWLRSPDDYNSFFAYLTYFSRNGVRNVGHIYDYGTCEVHNTSNGVRPACYIVL